MRQLALKLGFVSVFGLLGCGVPVSDEEQSADDIEWVANPAAVNCIELGGTSESVEGPDGTSSICVLPNGVRCEQWALYWGECSPNK